MVDAEVNSTPQGAKVRVGIEAISLNDATAGESANGHVPGASDATLPAANGTAMEKKNGAPAEQEKVVLTPEVKEVVKATVPVLKQYGSDIVLRFYHLLFERYPQLRKQFNMDRNLKGASKTEGLPSQVYALSRAILAYAANIDKVQVLLPTVIHICHKHVSRAVVPPQYDFVGDCLIAAIKDTLGAAATEKIVKAWTVAYTFLANLFIETEKTIKETAEKQAGYSGFKKMAVKHVGDAKNGERALWMLPEDGIVPGHSAGQYLAISLDEVEGIGPTMLTAFIDEVSKTELRLRIRKNEERATKHIFEKVTVGSTLDIGVACGVVKEK